MNNYSRAIVSSALLLSLVSLAGSILPIDQPLLAQPQDDRGIQPANPVPVPSRQSSDRRVALVIGNSAYTTISPLQNPANDARDMTTALQNLNFDRVIPVYDANLQAMETAIDQFYDELKRGSVGVFYYAGHGVQSNGENYLIPVDAKIDIEADLRYKALPVGLILNRLAEAGNDVSIVILDACRDNPFRSWGRNASRGLASVDAPKGVFIAYATAPGSVASDGQGRNGTFTEALLRHIQTPGLAVELLFKEVRRDVQTATTNRQTPWESTSLVGDFSFKPASEPIAIRSQPTPTPTPAPRSTPTPTPQPTPTPAPRSTPTPVPPSSVSSRTFLGIPVEPFSYTTAEVSGTGTMRTFTRQAEVGRYVEQQLTLPAGAVPLEMVAVEGGTFLMGSPDTEVNRNSVEGPQHQVTVPDFFMGRYEVTQAQYKAVMGSNPANFKGDNNPVESVSWDHAQIFIQRLNSLTGKTYRLPTEAEWEYAARAGTTTPFSYGETIMPEVVNYNNYNGNFPYGGAPPKGEYRQRTIAVDSLYPNPWGLYHIHGNVWEWCADEWHNSYSNKPDKLKQDGSIAWTQVNTNAIPHNASFRRLRGGSWRDVAGGTRSAYRSIGEYGYFDGGFRVLLSSRIP